MKLSIVSVTAIAATLSASAAFAQDKVKFEYWYGLSGQLGDSFNLGEATERDAVPVFFRGALFD